MSPEPGGEPAAEAAPSRAVARAIRTPRSAALAGIAFAALFTVALVMIHTAVPDDPADAGQWLSDDWRRELVLRAVGLVPFAGIAFLWFLAVLRDRVGALEDRFFATVFLGSGLLFVGTIFVAAAVAAGVIAAAGRSNGDLAASGTWAVGSRITSELMGVYAMRMAAVFALVTSTIMRRTALAPRWLVLFGSAIGVVLLVTVGSFAWVWLAFPTWVLVLSVHVLVVEHRRTRPGPGNGDSQGRDHEAPTA